MGVFADVTGSATLIWRFRAEISDPAHSGRRERQSAVIVSLALAVTAIVLAAESANALAQRSQPAASAVTLTAASLSLLVLTPLAIAKRRLGTNMTSRALQGDGALSGIGAATSFLAITALILYQLAGWWWADRVTALVVAGAAGSKHGAPFRADTGWKDVAAPPAQGHARAAGQTPIIGVAGEWAAARRNPGAALAVLRDEVHIRSLLFGPVPGNSGCSAQCLNQAMTELGKRRVLPRRALLALSAARVVSTSLGSLL